MKFKVYKSITKFMSDTLDLLKTNELQNNLIIGNCLRAEEYNLETKKYFLATILDDNNDIKIVTMLTPPYKLLVYEVNNEENNEALELLIDYCKSNKLTLPGIVAKNDLCERFSKIYARKNDIIPKVKFNMRIYKLDEVKYRGDAEGKLRLATMNDLNYLSLWKRDFALENNIEYDDKRIFERMKTQIKKGFVYVFEDKEPVSMITAGRKTLNGVIFNNVYTKSLYRRQGYATALVYELASLLLREFSFCGLFTDLKNPISNRIYQKVGFYPICDFNEIEF